MRRTKPQQLSCFLSIGYSDFRADFREVRITERFLYIADLGLRPIDPKKPNADKALLINSITKKADKQTQWHYPAFYQLFAAILGPIFMKFGWKRRGSLSGIRAQRQRLPGAEKAAFVGWSENHREALAIAPLLRRGTVSDSPLDVGQALKQIA